MTFRVFGPIIAGLLGIAGAAIPGGEAAASQESELQARVWINDGEGRILNQGSRARIYYRASLRSQS